MTAKQLKEYIRDQVRIEVAVLMPRLLKEILSETLKQYSGSVPETSVTSGNSEKRGRLFDSGSPRASAPAASLSPSERRNMYAKYIEDAKPAHLIEAQSHISQLEEGKIYDGLTGEYIEVNEANVSEGLENFYKKNYSAALKK